MTPARTVVMSIHPHHAARIYALDKRFEFRRIGPGFKVGDLMIVYETRPVGYVTGEAIIDEVRRHPVEFLPSLESDRAEREQVAQYLAGARRPVALRLGHVIRYPVRRSLTEIGLDRAPQSYQFLEA